jgi:capsule polysaccharide export protein KpsE/RkpR
LTKAEADVKQYMKQMDFQYKTDGFTELAILPLSKLSLVKNEYVRISKEYLGNISVYTDQIKTLQADKLLLETQLELADQKLISANRNIELLEEKMETQKLRFENQLLQMKLNAQHL